MRVWPWRFRSVREPDNYESSLLQLLIDVPGDSAVSKIGGDHAMRILGADTPVHDHFNLLDAGEGGREVLVEVWTILGDDDEDPHAGSLPRPVPGGRAIFRSASVTLVRGAVELSYGGGPPIAGIPLDRGVTRPLATLARRLLIATGFGETQCV